MFSFATSVSIFQLFKNPAIFVSLLLSYETFAGLSMKIVVHYQVKNRPDTLYLLKNESLGPAVESRSAIYKASGGGEGIYRFDVPVNAPDETFRITRKVKGDTTQALFRNLDGSGKEYLSVSSEFYCVAGDDIVLKITAARPSSPLAGVVYFDYKYNFNGAGSIKHASKFKIDSLLFGAYDKKPSFDSALVFHGHLDLNKSIAIRWLDSIRDSIPVFYYNLQKADILYYKSAEMFSSIRASYNAYIKAGANKEQFKHVYNQEMNGLAGRVDGPELFYSRNYVRFFVEKAMLDCLVNFSDQQPETIFESIAKIEPHELRDRAIVVFLKAKNPQNLSELYASALRVVKDRKCLYELEMVKVRGKGFRAFKFTLPDRFGNMVSLDDFLGKWIFIDFWFTGCGACKAYFKNTLSGTEQAFENDPRIRFLSISVDSNKSRWEVAVDSQNYTSDNAVNLYTNGEGAKNTLIGHYNISSYPSALIIDPTGTVHSFNAPELLTGGNIHLIEVLNRIMDDKYDPK